MKIHNGKILGLAIGMILGTAPAAMAQVVEPVGPVDNNAAVNPEISIPPWVTYCVAYVRNKLPCNYQTWVDRGGYKPPTPAHPPVTIPAATGPQWGTSDATVFAAFPPTILHNFQLNAAINTQIAKMQWPMMARLSTELQAHDPGNAYRPSIYIAAAKRLTATNLAFMRSAFGTIIDVYVADYAPAAVHTAYVAIKPYSALYLSTYYWQLKGIAPEVFPSSMAYYDVYLDQYTTGVDNPTVSLKKATTYMQIRQKASALEILGALGAITGIISFFDLNAWADIKQTVSDWRNSAGQIWPPTVLVPGGAGGGYPTTPTAVPAPDITAGDPIDPNAPGFPGYNFPGDEGYIVCGPEPAYVSC